MKVRWLESAVTSLRAIHQFVASRNSDAAKTVVSRIERTVERLETHPLSGRTGTVEGTREVVIPGLPYLVVYRIRDNEVQILRVWHTRQDFH
jgi:toxin ParE1/3/4